MPIEIGGLEAENKMSYPLFDSGFTHWYGDLETQLKRYHGTSIKELGLTKRFLADEYYEGQSIFTVIEHLRYKHALC